MSKRTIRIGTRESALAMWQAKYVARVLSETYPEISFPIIGMTTMGDKNLLIPLSSFDNKGVFTKELDVALLTDKVDIVVHCVKDLPTTLPEGVSFAAILEREPPADAVILHPKHLAAFAAYKDSAEAKAYAVANPGASLALNMLPPGAVIGTSALRRRATLARHHPHLVAAHIRGNVLTRLNKLDSGEFDAIILARVGLERLDLPARVAEELSASFYLHAVGQGALAVVVRSADVPCATAPALSNAESAAPGPANARRGIAALDAATAAAGELVFAALQDSNSESSCTLERGMLAALQGGCKVPIAVYSEVATVAEQQAQALIAQTEAEVAATMEAAAAAAAAAAADAAKAAETGTATATATAEGDCKAKEALRNNRAVTAAITLPAPAAGGSAQGADAAGTVDVVLTRAAVLSLDGAMVSECNGAVALPHGLSRAERQGRAWAAGRELGDRLRKLGAEVILKEIR